MSRCGVVLSSCALFCLIVLVFLSSVGSCVNVPLLLSLSPCLFSSLFQQAALAGSIIYLHTGVSVVYNYHNPMSEVAKNISEF